MKYDIEADWHLLTTCNFRCDYCYFSPKALGAKIHRHGTVNQWRDGFARTGKRWLLHLTGGEPSVYPDFIELCILLAADHYLSLNSNLAHPRIDQLVDAVDPQRVHFIHASLHFDERMRRGEMDRFVEHAHRLRENQFHVLVSQVAAPEVLPRLDEIAESMADRGILIFPKAMRGLYRGAIYPAAYGPEDRLRILKLLEQARAGNRKMLESMHEPPTINLFNEERRLEQTGYRGRLCSAGVRFVRLDAAGRVFRCGSQVCYGNILRGNVTLPSETRRCRTTYCPYFCDKYSVPEDSWQLGDRPSVP